MLRLIVIVFHAVRALFRSRSELAFENLALRQQVAVLKAKRSRPRLSIMDRAFWVALRRVWPKWTDALIIVEPETVVRWHRAGFKVFWRWKSRRIGRPGTEREIRELIRRIASENSTWGAPRVHAELQKLGFTVSERTVSRYMPKRPTDPNAIERWKVFLRNHRHGIAAMDFFTVPTVTFNVLYILFVIHHARRQILHFNVTAHPASEWVVQQLREAFPYETAPRYLIFDRDGKFGPSVVAAIKTMGIKPSRTAFRSPWQNGVAERWIGSVRREMLNHVVVLNENHLRRLLHDYVTYYRVDRTHLGLRKDSPLSRPLTPKPSQKAKVVSLPRVGGLHHRYKWREVA
jgi:transposase InsO family protein